MGRFGALLGTGLLIAGTAFHSGCSGSGSSILTGSNPAQEKAASSGVFLPDLTGRPEQVAFISACAQAYGYAHDAVKIRANYLSYEAKQGATPAKLARIEKTYDATYQAIEVLGNRKSSYCAAKDGEEVRAELRRYTSGFFEPRTPPPAVASADWKKSKGDPDCGARC